MALLNGQSIPKHASGYFNSMPPVDMAIHAVLRLKHILPAASQVDRAFGAGTFDCLCAASDDDSVQLKSQATGTTTGKTCADVCSPV